MSSASETDPRFSGLARLFGQTGAARLRPAHVCVVGVGGVGSWTAEALARSGVGTLTLVDLDEICVSNVNRQLHAVEASVGRSKVEVMAERLHAIHPFATVHAIAAFFTAATADQLLAPDFTFVVDAIDALENKVRLLAACRRRGLPVVSCGAAGGRRDPTRIRVADLADATHDRLLGAVRKCLRHEHGFPPDGQPFGIPCVFSVERPVFPQPDGSVGEARLDRRSGAELRLNCDGGFGTAAFVTGAFGLAAAAEVVRRLTAGD